MKNITKIEFYTGSKEERLPDFSSNFPYIASHVELNQHCMHCVPWHWHKSVELFYTECGELEYSTPKGKIIFSEGSGGLVNSNVLHMARLKEKAGRNIQLLHIFTPSFIAGETGGRIEQKYIMPIITAPQLEIIALHPDNPAEGQVLDLIRESFCIQEQEFGYELKLREALSEIWLKIFELSQPTLNEKANYEKVNDKIKLMMIYIHEHFAEKISIAELASAAFSSERECFRAFQECLHMTPVDYMKSYRIQMACQMLTESREAITVIGNACGLGSSSYFGKVFREHIGCAPAEYRHRWRDNDIIRQK